MPFPFLAIGLGLAVAQTGAQVAGGIFAKKKADKAKRLQKRLLKLSAREEAFQFEKSVEELLGAQRAGFAAGGVMVGGGTPAAIRRETESAAVRARRHMAFSYVYERKGLSTQGGANVAGYFSGLQNIMSSASAFAESRR